MMDRDIFCIVEVRTVGKGRGQKAIVEICLLRMQGGTMTDRFHSFLDPQWPMPQKVPALFLVEGAMQEGRPLFNEVAGKILELTREAILVMEDTFFQYLALQEAFGHMGQVFERPKLSLPGLCKKLVPGLFSYRLKEVFSSLGILLDEREGSVGYTDAMAVLFGRLRDLDPDFKVIGSTLFPKSTVRVLPSHLKEGTLEGLPQRQGVYYFMDREGKVCYVGKSKNIKKRVVSHFHSKDPKEKLLCADTFGVQFVVTGNELLALLLEAEGIQEYLPPHNKVQKKLRLPYRITLSTGRKGILRLSLKRTAFPELGNSSFFSRAEALEKLKGLCAAFQLCPIYCGLEKGIPCDLETEGPCKGICCGEEGKDPYNKRVRRALDALGTALDSYIISGRGRNAQEDSFVLVYRGCYKGFGYVGKEEQITRFDEVWHFLEPKRNTNHAAAIIANHLRRNPMVMAPNGKRVHIDQHRFPDTGIGVGPMDNLDGNDI